MAGLLRNRIQKTLGAGKGPEEGGATEVDREPLGDVNSPTEPCVTGPYL